MAYGASILDAVGANFGAVSKVGSDFKYWDQVSKKPLLCQNSLTTSFIDDYRGGDRTARVGAVCEKIFDQDIVDTSFIGIACGLIGEVTPMAIARLKQNSKYLLCDAQGLIRALHPDGSVYHRALAHTEFAQIAPQIDFLKMSEQEAPFIDLSLLKKDVTLLITKGSKGCVVKSAQQEWMVPAPQVKEVDGTGAGDCFLAGFAFALSQGFEVQKAAEFGCYCGALAVQHVGIPKLTREEFKTL